jgi:pimeloyl-ACP methyl ester carboxylesterase
MEEGRQTAEQIKAAEFIEMEGIGHFPMRENTRSLEASSSRPCRESRRERELARRDTIAQWILYID